MIVPAKNKELRRAYYRWRHMLERCEDATDKGYMNYGARGIRVCDRWHNFDNYYSDIQELGERPTPAHSIDRIDNDGNYEPGNVRWADRREQVLNRRLFRRNTSGYPGICWYAKSRKWLVRPVINGELVYLGYFKDKEQAVEVWRRACA